MGKLLSQMPLYSIAISTHVGRNILSTDDHNKVTDDQEAIVHNFPTLFQRVIDLLLAYIVMIFFLVRAKTFQ